MNSPHAQVEAVRAVDLESGDVLASGCAVVSVETGGPRLGDTVQVTFADGRVGRCGRENRILRNSRPGG